MQTNALHGGHYDSAEADIGKALKSAKEQEVKVEAWRQNLIKHTSSELDSFVRRLAKLFDAILDAHKSLLEDPEKKAWLTVARRDGMPLNQVDTEVSEVCYVIEITCEDCKRAKLFVHVRAMTNVWLHICCFTTLPLGPGITRLPSCVKSAWLDAGRN